MESGVWWLLRLVDALCWLMNAVSTIYCMSVCLMPDVCLCKHGFCKKERHRLTLVKLVIVY